MSEVSTPSEELFKTYLEARGLSFEYEAEIGGRRPDFRVSNDNQDIICEVTAITRSFLGHKRGPSFFDPYTGLRRKIAEKAKQARGTKGKYPYVIVIRFEYAIIPVEQFVPGAMYGDDGFEMEFDPATGSAGDISPTFLRGGRLQKNRNTRVSAIAVLRTFNPTRVSVEQEVRRLKRASTSAEECARIAEQMFAKYDFHHTDVPRLDVFHNVYASEPRLPADAFSGPYDRHWDIDEHHRYRNTWTGSRFESEVG